MASAGVWRVLHKPRVAIRADPSTTAAIVGVVKHGETLQACEHRKEWIRVQDEQPGWVLVDGTSVGLGQLLERLDDQLIKLRVVHPTEPSQPLVEFELLGEATMGQARAQFAQRGLQPAAVLPFLPNGETCSSASVATSLADDVVLSEAGFRSGRDMTFVYNGEMPDKGSMGMSHVDALLEDSADILRRLRNGTGSLEDVVAVRQAGKEREGLTALLESLSAGCREAGMLLFAWSLSPHFGEVTGSDGRDGIRVVLIFGWGGSTARQLQGPRQFWEALGCTTVVATRTPFNIQSQVAAIAERIPTHASVLVHAFSNNGLYLLHDFLCVWEGKVCGLVVDSAPDNSSNLTLLRQVTNGCIRALCALCTVTLNKDQDNALASFSLLAPLQEGDIIALDHGSNGLHMSDGAAVVLRPDGICRGSLEMSGVRDSVSRQERFKVRVGHLADRSLTASEAASLSEPDSTCGGLLVSAVAFPDLRGLLRKVGVPALFLYSRTDTLVKAAAVEEYVRECTADGQARSVCFEGSHHVRHFDRHRAKYAEELVQFARAVGFT